MLVLPRIISPALISFCAIAELCVALAPTRAQDPAVVPIPRSDAVMKLS